MIAMETKLMIRRSILEARHPANGRMASTTTELAVATRPKSVMVMPSVVVPCSASWTSASVSAKV